MAQEDTEAAAKEKVQQLLSFQSDDLLEKLKLLNYEKHLLREFKLKPLSRFYFVKSVNPGEQFFMFTLICWWLCKKLGKDMERPQEFDDPNTVIAKIIQILEEIDVPVDFQPNKLIRGAGPICLMVLDRLATQALKVTQLAYQHLNIAQEEEFVGDYLEDNAEIILEKLEDEQNAAALSDDSDMELEAHNFKQLNWLNRQQKRSISDMAATEEQTRELNSRLTDHQEWRLELEHVLQQLKVVVKADARDWRTHLSQMETLKSNIAEIAETTQTQLKKLHSEFTFSLDKIESREKHLNNELQPLIKQYKDVSIELSSVQYAQTQVQEDTARQLEQLNEVQAEQDMRKEEMERRGQVMSDGSSVQQIKKAIAKLKDDIAQLNLEVALLVHAYDQDVLRQTQSAESVSNVPAT
ncbi:intraflagellar transport protein 57 homolog [Scaptodrosophila lebanonensis]|uniref:Intraflagellar transport protein 57 homolog n=1 Tax=Drosophila lebanonensis TaxID=7225 RepID=A0A6J2U7C0_DROLE|nr:intraflagellar transport protein 57 homolog [Scaptodrosophila lebanonensis]